MKYPYCQFCGASPTRNNGVLLISEYDYENDKVLFSCDIACNVRYINGTIKLKRLIEASEKQSNEN